MPSIALRALPALPAVGLGELRLSYPHFEWPAVDGVNLLVIVNLIRISLPSLDFPPVPRFDHPAWGVPSMVLPTFKVPGFGGFHLPDLGHLPQFNFHAEFNAFKGFLMPNVSFVKLRILISLVQVLTQLGIVSAQ